MMARALTMACLALFTAMAAAIETNAQSAPPVRVRGQIEGFADRVLTVKSREGATVKILLAEQFTVTSVVKADIADIKANSYIGAAALKGADGRWYALEVLVFPESARGAGEGHYPWDLKPESTMTNGTVGTVTDGSSGRMLKVAYKGGDQPIEITVPPEAPIVTFAAGSPDMLKPGSHIFASTARGADGTLGTARVLVGANGLVPPM